MIRRNPRPLGIIERRRRTCLVHDVVPLVPEVGFLLFPEEVDVEALHEGEEVVCDVLQDFGFFFERGEQTTFEVGQRFGNGEAGEVLDCGEEVGFGAAVVGSAEEEDGVGAGGDGLDVGDFAGGARCRVG